MVLGHLDIVECKDHYEFFPSTKKWGVYPYPTTPTSRHPCPGEFCEHRDLNEPELTCG